MFTAIRAETAHSPTYQLLRGEIKKRGGRSPGSGNQVIAGRQNVTDWTGVQHPGFSSLNLNYVLKQLYRKKSGPRTPRPPGGPPFLGMLA